MGLCVSVCAVQPWVQREPQLELGGHRRNGPDAEAGSRIDAGPRFAYQARPDAQQRVEAGPRFDVGGDAGAQSQPRAEVGFSAARALGAFSVDLLCGLQRLSELGRQHEGGDAFAAQVDQRLEALERERDQRRQAGDVGGPSVEQSLAHFETGLELLERWWPQIDDRRRAEVGTAFAQTATSLTRLLGQGRLGDAETGLRVQAVALRLQQLSGR